jgi:ATP-binding cassette subfamily B protein
MNAAFSTKRCWLIPEVVQSSAMDCGPAVLACLLRGFGIPAHYGRLREACQTDVDGTSIDVLETVAGQLGLQAEQVMLPVNHLLLPEAEALPAILVVRLPNGLTHFVLVWRRHGPFLQVMDPARGRRWVRGCQFLQEIYVHRQRVPAGAWREWARTEEFRRPVLRRLRDLGLGRSGVALFETAAAAPDWRALARLDAVTRFVESMVRAGGLQRGREAANVLQPLLERTRAETADLEQVIPDAYWSVRVAPPAADGQEQVCLHGAVLVRVRGRCRTDHALGSPSDPLGPELAAALAEPASRPGRTLFQLLRKEGLFAILLLVVGLGLAAGAAILEAVLLQGAIEVGRNLGLVEQRLLAVGCLAVFAGALLLLEYLLVGGLLRLGRHLEIRLRLALLQKIPRLHDRYLQSRPTSDMAERSHALHRIRLLPRLGGQFLRAALTLAATAAAIAWVDPASALPATVAAVCAVGLPLLFLPLLSGLDLRVRTHAGALDRFYLDALLGLAAVRAHAAERVVGREHEGLLAEWARASRQFLHWVVALEGLQMATGFGLAGWLLFLHANRGTEVGGVLLLAYWALSLPALGEEIAALVRQYPTHRNLTLRLLEPLGAPEEVGRIGNPSYEEGRQASSRPTHGVAIQFKSVTVRAAGHTILEDVNLDIEAGSHVAIVGASGAGKSSLVGLLLGWHRVTAGRVFIDGEPLDAARLEQLREETAWVDPAVQLWNHSLAANLAYGTPNAEQQPMGDVLERADLYGVLQRLPHGLQTPLGEGGGLVSGGEGQRVRLGRALVRAGARLVILDEPGRGLDRGKRHALLRRAREHWPAATLLCVTHDIADTREFERVLVVEAGRIVEDGLPRELARTANSRYRGLLLAERAVRTGLWSSLIWRRFRLAAGRLIATEESA